MTAFHQRIVDGTGNRKHLATLIGGHVGGDQRTTLECCFHHQHPQTESTNDAITAGKEFRPRLHPNGELRHQRTLFHHLFPEPTVAYREYRIKAMGQYGNGAAGLQGTAVGSRIDTQGQAAGGHKAMAGKMRGKLLCQFLALTAAMAAADDGNLGQIQHLDLTPHEQQRWRAANLPQ